MLFRICPLTMRTQGILLVRDAVFLLELSRDPSKCSQYITEFGLTFCVV